MRPRAHRHAEHRGHPEGPGRDQGHHGLIVRRFGSGAGRRAHEARRHRAQAGQTAEVVAELLERHYDPGYESSTSRNFRHYAQAERLVLAGPDMQAMAAGAAQLLRSA